MAEANRNINSIEDDDNDVSIIHIYLSDIWRGIVKFWWLCIALAVLVGGIFFVKSYAGYFPVYQASATFTVQTLINGQSDTSDYAFYYNRNTVSLMSSTFTYILQSNLLQEAVCADLNLTSLPVTISASSVTDTNMFTLKTSGSDPQLVYDVLLSVIDNYPQVAEYVVGNTKLDMIIVPTVPEEPVNQFSYKSQTLKGALIGLALGCLWIIIYAVLRKTIRKKQDIQLELNQQCLGVLPDVYFKKYNRKIDRRVILTNPRIGTGFLESVRLFRNAVTHSLGPDDKVILITSTAPGEGKSTVSVNLAVAIAKTESRTLLVDMDTGNSGLRKLLDIKIKDEKIIDQNDFYSVVFLEELNVYLMVFKRKGDKMLSRIDHGNVKKILKTYRTLYDYIIVDTPPSGLLADAAVLASVADAAIFVIRQDGIRLPVIRKTLEDLKETDIKILGCVLNGASSGISGYGDNYGYGYRYSYGSSYGYRSGYDKGYGKR